MAFCPKHILLASDFEEAARAAEVDAALLARAFDAGLKVVHVQPFAWQESRELADRATRALEQCAERLRTAGARVQEPQLLHGSAAETLINAAEASAMDLIVIGGAARSDVAGATVETVARFAREPVWISRPRTGARIGRILCGVDGSVTSEHAACDAIMLASTLSAHLVFVHVIDRSHAEAFTAAGSAQQDSVLRATRAAIERVDRFLDGLGSLGVGGTRRHISGCPAEVLRNMAHEESFDMVVMGRTGTGGLRRVALGSTAERLLRTLSCGLLLTNPAAQINR